MEALWQAAIALTGIAGVGAFVLYALYRDWMKLPALSTLSRPQRFSLFKLFLILTFLFAIASLGLSAYRSHLDRGAERASAAELLRLLEDRHTEGLVLIAKFQETASPHEREKLDAFKKTYEAHITGARRALSAGDFVRFHELNKQLLVLVQEFEHFSPIQRTRFVGGACFG